MPCVWAVCRCYLLCCNQYTSKPFQKREYGCMDGRVIKRAHDPRRSRISIIKMTRQRHERMSNKSRRDKHDRTRLLSQDTQGNRPHTAHTHHTPYSHERILHHTAHIRTHICTIYYIWPTTIVDIVM
jgi:hypothetical protein